MSSQSLPNSPQWTPLRPGTAASPKAVQPPRMGHGRPGDTSHPRSLEDIPRLERPHEMRKRAADADDSSLDLLAVHQCFKRFALSSRDEPSTPHHTMPLLWATRWRRHKHTQPRFPWALSRST